MPPTKEPSKLLLFLTFLSANLAVINFLPIPVLDGGHFVFLLYEGIRGKPADERVQVDPELPRPDPHSGLDGLGLRPRLRRLLAARAPLGAITLLGGDALATELHRSSVTRTEPDGGDRRLLPPACRI